MNKFGECLSGYSKWPSGNWLPFEGFAPLEYETQMQELEKVL